MGWFSILPDSLSGIERWVARFFILLALLTIGPWAVIFIYDILLYFFRTVTYEIPLVGGRARGRQRPRAPSLKERPSGRPRRFSLAPQSSQPQDAPSDIKTRVDVARRTGSSPTMRPAELRSERRMPEDA